jgi:hypothetical protein
VKEACLVPSQLNTDLYNLFFKATARTSFRPVQLIALMLLTHQDRSATSRELSDHICKLPQHAKLIQDAFQIDIWLGKRSGPCHSYHSIQWTRGKLDEVLGSLNEDIIARGYELPDTAEGKEESRLIQAEDAKLERGDEDVVADESNPYGYTGPDPYKH